MKQFKTSLILSVLVIAMLSCKKEDIGTPQKGSVEFAFEVSTPLKSATMNADPTAVVISVEDPEGNSVYKNEQVLLTQTNGSYTTAPITFEPGSYKLTKFLVVDADGTVLHATPMGFSKDASLVDNPLPINFNVQLGVVTKLMPGVVSTQNINAQDFGYTSFKLNEQTSFKFQLGVYTYNTSTNQFELTTANLSLTSDAGEALRLDLLSVIDSIKVKEAGKYLLSVSKDGYQTWTDTLTQNDLLRYYANPMVVTLDKTNENSINFTTVQDTLTRLTINITSSDNSTPLRVNWGDGKIEVYKAATKLIHDYTVTGTYDVKLTGAIESIAKLGLTHAQISFINLEKAVNLTYIEISRNQKLKALNLSNMHQLKEVYCVEGSLTNLNLTNSENIEQIYCSLNNLENLDVTALSALKTLYCDRNKLTALDTKYNQNLNVLFCYQNALTALDITNNSSLVTLDCRNNKLVSLDITKSFGLTKILVSYNSINNENANKILVDLLQTTKTNPRSGQISLSISLSGSGQTAKEGLEKTYLWTVNAI